MLSIKRKFMLDIRHLGIELFLLFDRVKTCIIKSFLLRMLMTLKKTWKGIRNIINIRNSNKGQPTSMLIGKELKSLMASILSFPLLQEPPIKDLLCRRRLY